MQHGRQEAIPAAAQTAAPVGERLATKPGSTAGGVEAGTGSRAAYIKGARSGTAEAQWAIPSRRDRWSAARGTPPGAPVPGAPPAGAHYVEQAGGGLL